ncbi:MAG: citrate lyase holo-[acyl-carrier protein] synthase [Candidatus Heimdallarchaeota archaeon]
MSDQKEIQKQILDAKENRWIKQQNYLKEHGSTIMSFKLNIPHWPKYSEKITSAFDISLRNFLKLLTEKKILFNVLSQEETALGPEAFIHCNEVSNKIKEITVNFEEEYTIGRLLDLDVLGQDGKPLERTTKRLCLICSDISINCMRTGKHTSKKVREVFDKIIISSLEI